MPENKNSISYSSIPCTRVWPNLKAAEANTLVMVGLTVGSYLVLYPYGTGRMSSWPMKSVPRTIGSHSLYVVC